MNTNSASFPSVPLVKDVTWALIAQAGRFALQGISFLLLARILRAEGLGLIAGTMGLVNVLVPFCGWGGANLLLKYVARDRSTYPLYCGNALLLIVLSGVGLTALAVGLGPMILRGCFQWPLFLLMIGSEMLVLRLVDMATLSFQAIDRMDLVAAINLLSGGLRLSAILLCMMGTPFPVSPTRFAAWYFATSVLGAAVSVAMLWTQFRHLGPLRISRTVLLRTVREGLPFSVGIASKSVYSDIDKTMLARMSTSQATGMYTAAYRLLTMAVAPVQAVVISMSARLFRKGAEGTLPAARYASRAMPMLLAYSALVGILLTVVAPLVPLALGPSFAETARVLRWLAWMPAIQAIHGLLGEVLTGADRQGFRSTCQLALAGFNIMLNLLLIPTMSWRGAVLATYASEGLLALSMIGMVAYHQRRLGPVDRRCDVALLLTPAGILAEP
jgi:O-antigen/teichoic acid export membrane protein